MFKKPWVYILWFCISASIALAQTSFGSIMGQVSDATGALIPGAQLALTNMATGTRIAGASNQDGIYQFVNVPPGEYKLDADAPAFRHFIRQPVIVQVQQTYRVDIQMIIGAATESVEVTAEVALLQPQTSSLGQVVSGRSVAEMPLNGRNVFNLMQLVPSVIPQGTAGGASVGMFSASFNNYQVNGSFGGQSIIFLDGQPLSTGFWNYASLIPTQDSVAEFKVQTNNLGPEWGRSAGGVMNLTTRSGTNRLHGAAYEYLRNKVLNANTFFGNAAGIERTPFTQNQFGAYAGGPVFIPHVHDGRNKTFWFVSWEAFRQRIGHTYTSTVPTAIQRQGDFSNTRNASGALIPIYDPLSVCGQYGNSSCAVGANGQPTYVRRPFPNNVIPPSRFSNTAALLTDIVWPLPPNSPGAPYTNANNITVNGSLGGNQNEVVNRIDENISDRQRLFARYSFWNTLNIPAQPYRNGYCVGQCTVQFQTSIIVLDHTYAISPTLFTDVHVGFNRYAYSRLPVLSGFDLTKLGWPAWYNQIPFVSRTPPNIVVSGVSDDLYNGGGPTGTILSRDNTWSASADITKVVGVHTLKGGAQFAQFGHSYYSPQSAGGTFSFDSGYTASSPLSGSGGYSLASFLLGYPASGSAGVASYPNSQQRYRAFYFGDTWQATSRLSLNFGIRYDLDGPWSERYNRITFWDLTGSNQLAGPTGLPLKGQVAWVNSSLHPSRNPWEMRKKQFAPRFGFAYQPARNWVLRGGYGVFWIPELSLGGALQPNGDPVNSTSTPFVSTVNGGITPVGTLNDPFPDGIVQPLNPASGPTALNQTILELGGATDGTPHVRNGYMQQWNFNAQRELPGGFLLDVAYGGSKGTHLGYTQVLNQLPSAFMPLGSALLQAVPNPFYGLIKSGPLAASTVTAGQLLLVYPQYSKVNVSGTGYATSSYHSFQLKLEKHFRAGGVLLLSYTNAKLLSDTDTALSQTESSTGGVAAVQDWNNIKGSYSLSSQDVPQRLSINYVLDLPFGAGKKYFSGLHGVAGKLVSGWGVNGITTFQRGFPLKFTTSLNLTNSNGGGSSPNVVGGCNKDMPGSAEERLSKWFNTACFTQPAAFSFGNEPRVDPTLRMQGIGNFDFALFKTTQLREGVGLQFRAEVFNLSNTPQFGGPGQTYGTAQFGVVNSQVNNQRLLQFGLKMSF